MKKTIIITIAMLCVFGAAIMIGANEVSNKWQKTDEDELTITPNSPVENVENEFKEFGAYPFITFSEHIQTLEDKRGMEALIGEGIEKNENMISEAEAAYIGGNALETLFPNETFTDKQFVIILLKCKSPHTSEHTVYEGFYNIENPENHPVHPSRLILQCMYLNSKRRQILTIKEALNRHLNMLQNLQTLWDTKAIPNTILKWLSTMLK